MSSRVKQMLCFAAGVAVGVATTSIGQVLMVVARRPASNAANAFDPAPHLDTATAGSSPDVPPVGVDDPGRATSPTSRQRTYEPTGATAGQPASWD
ncbi:hypothetical protein [Dactylosporangium matsuzakiense]|nr:hypothetical protein [Dactylosporangium matsuzakiense]